MRLVFEGVSAHLECKKCNSPLYMTSVGAGGYTMHTVEEYGKQKCRRCRRELDVVIITGVLRRANRHVYVR